MIYIEAIQDIKIPSGMPSLFMGGGITGCPDWQAEVKDRLSVLDLVLINPRRANFPINDPAAAKEQIIWEHLGLNLATAISFWFPCETLCPITLYELGTWTVKENHGAKKPLFIGTHPDYKRAQDVLIQTNLVRNHQPIYNSVETLCNGIKEWVAYLENTKVLR